MLSYRTKAKLKSPKFLAQVAVRWTTWNRRPAILRRLWMLWCWSRRGQMPHAKALGLAKFQLLGGAKARVVWDVYAALLADVYDRCNPDPAMRCQRAPALDPGELRLAEPSKTR